jgi:acyl-CoA synthetase (AMP-forming)/AMP-acid ligase II
MTNIPLNTSDFCYRARTTHADRLGAVDETGAQGSLGRLTYGELMRYCDGMIEAMTSLGVRRGDRVAIVSPNALKMLVALWAVTGSGRVLVPINYRLNADAVQYIIDDSDTSLLLVDPELDERLAGLRAPRRFVMDGEQDAALFHPVDSAPEWALLDETEPASINYTSGTTGAPKGVVLTQRSHWLNAVVVGWELGLRADDVYLHTLPIFHVNGWGLPLAAAAFGVPNVIQREVRGPEILRRVEEEGVTLLCGATPVASTIAAASEKLRSEGAAIPGEGVTRMVSGGAPTPAAVIEHFERVTGWEMIHAYGLSEAGPVLTVNRVLPSRRDSPSTRAQQLAAAGSPLIGVRLSIDGEGELTARTPKAMTGYWRQPALSAEAFDGGWLRTGDGGQLSRGILRITDRKKDVIVTGGENVSSLQVEDCLHEHPDVVDVAVIGVPHERWGETPKALVVLRTGASFEQDDLLAFCRRRLAGFQCPTSIEQRESLPRTATGKIQKYLLRQPYWQQDSLACPEAQKND